MVKKANEAMVWADARLSPFEQGVLDSAIRFRAFAFGGRGRRLSQEADTLDAAKSAARALARENPRGSMVYAINAAGYQAMLGGYEHAR